MRANHRHQQDNFNYHLSHNNVFMKNKRIFSSRMIAHGPTNAERLYVVLRDRAWHATQELVAKVGHTFAVAKWQLIRLGCEILKRRTSANRRAFEYRMKRTPIDASKHIDGFGKR